MFDTILVPVDGSVPARRAAKYGLELAARYDASVDILHVIERGVLDDDDDRKARRRARGTEILDEVLELDIDGEPSVETHLVGGTPSRVIAGRVADGDVDLVVMGRHGRTGLGEHLFGTVADRVLRRVEAPVLTVADGEVRAETGRTYANVLLTTDGSEVAEGAAPYAADLAERTGATLHLLTVVDLMAAAGPFDAGGVSREYRDRLERTGREALDRLADRVDTTAVETRSSVAEGTPAAEIGAYADEHDVDLLVMASQGQTNLVGQYLGSTTRRVLRTVKRPVLVVPTPD